MDINENVDVFSLWVCFYFSPVITYRDPEPCLSIVFHWGIELKLYLLPEFRNCFFFTVEYSLETLKMLNSSSTKILYELIPFCEAWKGFYSNIMKSWLYQDSYYKNPYSFIVYAKEPLKIWIESVLSLKNNLLLNVCLQPRRILKCFSFISGSTQNCLN